MFNFIPYFIKDRIGKKNGFFKTVCLCTDLSGFTRITEKYLNSGKEGAENLSRMINIYSSPLVDSIYMNKGFISSAAGDSFIALFPDCEYKRVLQAINDLRLSFDLFFGIEIGIKIGIGYGEAEFGIVGDEKKAFYFRGEAIDNALNALSKSGKFEIIIDESFYLFANREEIEVQAIENGYYILNKIKLDEKFESHLNYKQVDFETAVKFFPEQVLNITSGEFREVASIFISFRNGLTYNEIDIMTRFILEKIDEYKGYFNCLDFGDKGGYYMINFGAPVVMEKNLEHACEFVLEVMKHYPELRIGMSFGLTYSGIIGNERRKYYSCIGVITNMAARLMQRAKINEILVSETVYEKMKNIYKFRFIEKDFFKGFANKQNYYSIIEKKNVISDNQFETEYIERKDSEEKLLARLENLKEQKNGGIVFVFGEAGIGKTRFIIETMKKVKMEIIYLKCEDIKKTGFILFKKYFSEIFGNTKKDFDTRFNGFLDEITINPFLDRKLLNEFKNLKPYYAILSTAYNPSELVDVQLSVKNNNIVEAIKIYIKIASTIKPLIIVVEDLHWIDVESERAISFLLKEVEKYPFIVVATSRYDNSGNVKIPSFDNDINRDIIELKHFDEIQIIEFIRKKIGKDPSQFLLKYINSNSNGNPFYIEEYLQYLIYNKLLEEDFNGYYKIKNQITELIPTNINSIILARFDSLPVSVKKIGEVASVIGYEFDMNVLEGISDISGLKYYLDIGEREKLWESENKLIYNFRHALIKEALYSLQMKAKVKKLHSSIAEMIKKLYGNKKEKKQEIAYHYEKAGDYEKAKEYYFDAAIYARNDYRSNEAIAIFNKLLTNATDKEKIDIYNNLGDIYLNLGNYNNALEYFYLSLELLDNENIEKDKAVAYFNLGNTYYFLEIMDTALDLMFKGLEMALHEKDESSEMLIYGGLANIYSRKREYDNALKYYKKQLGLASKKLDKEQLVYAMTNMGTVYWETGQKNKAEEMYKKSLSIAKEIKMKKYIGILLNNLGNIYYGYYHDYEKAKELYIQQMEYYKNLDFIRGVLMAEGNIIQVSMILGEYDNVPKLLEKMKEQCNNSDDLRGLAYYYKLYADYYYNLGNYHEAEKFYEISIPMHIELKAMNFYFYSLEKYIIILINKGETEKAKNYLDELIMLGEKRVQTDSYFRSRLTLSIYLSKFNIAEAEKVLDSVNKIELMKSHLAELNYYYWKYCGKNENKPESIKIYEELYEKNKRYDYKKRIEEMKNTPD